MIDLLAGRNYELRHRGFHAETLHTTPYGVGSSDARDGHVRPHAAAGPPLRFGENALSADPAGGLVVRVARPGTPPETVHRTLEFVTKIVSLGMEVTEPAAVPGLRQPVVTVERSA